MDNMDASEEAKNRKPIGLIAVLVFMILLIIGLVVGIVVINVKDNDGSINDEFQSELSYRMPGYDYDKISDETKVRLFDDMIKNKLQNDSNYTIEDALSDYEEMYKSSPDELKKYIAIYYASLIQEKTNDTNKAITVMLEVKELNSDNVGYYVALSDYYESVGDKEQSDYYRKMADDLVKESEARFREGLNEANN